MPLSPNPPRRVALLMDSAIAPRRRMLHGVARYIHEHAPWSIYLKPVGVDGSLRDWLAQWQGDGIIAAVFSNELEAIRERHIPLVDMVGVVPLPGVPLVHAHDHGIGRLGAEHLLARGFQHFGFIAYDDRDTFWSADRRAGFVACVEAVGFTCATYRMAQVRGLGGPLVWEQQQQGLAKWIEVLPKPVGVMTSTDLMGQQFLEACQRAQVIVPEQVAVIGADNDEAICRIASPPLSSVIINDHQRGYMAAAALDRLMCGEAPPSEPLYIPPSGVHSRQSTDIMAIEDKSIVTALRFLRDQAHDDISVEDVVARVPVSRSVLERRFRKTLGRTINDEMVRLRVNRAVELICETELPLKQVAFKAGFVTQSYMNTVFQTKLGRTPGSFRHPTH